MLHIVNASLAILGQILHEHHIWKLSYYFHFFISNDWNTL